MTPCDTRGCDLAVPMGCKKGLEIPLGNPHQPIYPVCDEQPVFDPAPDSSCRYFDELGDVLNCVEFRRRFWLAGFHSAPSSTLDAAARVLAKLWGLFELSGTSPISNRRDRRRAALSRNPIKEWFVTTEIGPQWPRQRASASAFRGTSAAPALWLPRQL